MAAVDDHDGSSWLNVGGVTAVPAIAMSLGSLAISAGQPPDGLQARLQHFSAGLLIGAVITDIFPILRQHLYTLPDKRVSGNRLIAAMLGVILALVLMYGLKAMELEGGEEDEAEANSKQLEKQVPLLRHPSPSAAPASSLDERGRLRHSIARLSARVAALAQLVGQDDVDREAVDEEVHGIDFLVDSARRRCRKAEPIDQPNVSRLRVHAAELTDDIAQLKRFDSRNLPALDAQLQVVAMSLRRIHTHADREHFRRWGTQRASVTQASNASEAPPRIKVPWGLVSAVVIDSMVDGMLIGLAASVDLTSGWTMAAATAIEMGFLGYSFAVSMAGAASRAVCILILSLPPLAMLAASMGAAAGAAYLEDRAAFVGLIAFALVALLFLVVEELLLEAHEKEDGSDAWHISIWFYVGLLLTFLLDVSMG